MKNASRNSRCNVTSVMDKRTGSCERQAATLTCSGELAEVASFKWRKRGITVKAEATYENQCDIETRTSI